MSLTIRDLEFDDEARWRELWDGYLAFYEAEVTGTVTGATWTRVIEPASPLFCLVAEKDGPNGREVIGFVNCVLHANTWAIDPVCYLEDLFVDPNARGQGAGRALIEAVIERAKSMQWHRVYWRTKKDNEAAQALYDKLADKTQWVTYEVDTSDTF